ncbi:hypothetical protein SKAU_G00244020 [Synaphobranchus kaupii]|uniref:Uncharacterized protein n=1 Tax=Synaphobranchus kaupii TaxID=118154 RepID=A0A9Q1F1J2_SYNKA|nr:hypothetical protein SKAU_G00244020 [Synaphobranchus kaupii]
MSCWRTSASKRNRRMRASRTTPSIPPWLVLRTSPRKKRGKRGKREGKKEERKLRPHCQYLSLKWSLFITNKKKKH